MIKKINLKIIPIILGFFICSGVHSLAIEKEAIELNQLPIELKKSINIDKTQPDILNTINQGYYKNKNLSELNTIERIQKLAQTDKLLLKKEINKENIKEVKEEEIPKANIETEEATRVVVEADGTNENSYEASGLTIGDTNYLGKFKITHYCACSSCCGPYASGITASGTRATANRTIAVNPRQIPYGTKVLINGQVYIAEDCGGGIGTNCIDIFVNTHQEALNKGVFYADVYIEK